MECFDPLNVHMWCSYHILLCFHAGGVQNGKVLDQAAAKACNSLSSILASLKKLLRREQKVVESLTAQRAKAIRTHKT